MAYYHQYSHTNPPMYHGAQDKASDQQYLTAQDWNTINSSTAHKPSAQMSASVTVPGPAVTSPSYSWCTAGWAWLSMWLCGFWGCCCGFMGLLCSIWSYADHKSGDYDRATHKKRWGIACVVLAFLLGVLSLVAVIIVIVLFNKQTCAYIEQNKFQELYGICHLIKQINV